MLGVAALAMLPVKARMRKGVHREGEGVTVATQGAPRESRGAGHHCASLAVTSRALSLTTDSLIVRPVRPPGGHGGFSPLRSLSLLVADGRLGVAIGSRNCRPLRRPISMQRAARTGFKVGAGYALGDSRGGLGCLVGVVLHSPSPSAARSRASKMSAVRSPSRRLARFCSACCSDHENSGGEAPGPFFGAATPVEAAKFTAV